MGQELSLHTTVEEKLVYPALEQKDELNVATT